MTEEELAIFDLLTKPEPVLDDAEREVVKASAKRLLDPPARQAGAGLASQGSDDRRRANHHPRRPRRRPARGPVPAGDFDAKVQAVFDHVVTRLRRRRLERLRRERRRAAAGRCGVAVLDRARRSTRSPTRSSSGSESTPSSPSLVAEQLGLAGGAALRTVDELIENDEDFAVEFKSTARWDLREGKPNKAMEDAVVKTVAGFLNTDGGTLLIGVGADRAVVGLEPRLPDG